MHYNLYQVITFFVWILIPFISLFNKKLYKRLKVEKKQYDIALRIKNNTNKIIIWIHAASGGEFEQIIPVLDSIDRKKYFILLSFMSPTIYSIQKNTKLADTVIYHPLDFYWNAKKFLNDFKPSFYILNRHDIWPNHIRLAKKMNVKVIIINFNIYEKSRRFQWFFRSFNRKIFSYFDKIYTGSNRMKTIASKLVNNKIVEVIGDTRFNRVQERKKLAKNNLLPDSFCKTKNIIFGSIIDSDFPVIFAGLHKKFPQGSKDLSKDNIGLIITPHEIDKQTISKLKKFLNNLKIDYVLYSDVKNNLKKNYPNTIIIDTVGILADLYQYGRISYIGGGFGLGVHNVLEPAVYGCLVSFGPNMFILDEAIDLYRKKLANIIIKKADFYEYLYFLDSDKKYKHIKKDLKKYVSKRKCDIDKMIGDILIEN